MIIYLRKTYILKVINLLYIIELKIIILKKLIEKTKFNRKCEEGYFNNKMITLTLVAVTTEIRSYLLFVK